jgi:hypothetical protein
MANTLKDLEALINSKIDEEIACEQFPYLCSKASTEVGKRKIAEEVKRLILKEGITDIDACFAQIEAILSEPESE